MSSPSTIEKQSDVRVWERDVVFPTYPAEAPDANPMFLQKRVYQGSSGKVYPNAFTDRVSREKRDQSYKAIMLENEFLQVMILPEIGGRIHVGLDKTNGYDFFYRQNVIKPALVGLLGPWISGGVEFNWPQHHRPTTYMPVHYHIERHEDGAVTVWLSEHEPMNRLKGMVGIRMCPGRSTIEARAQIFNRTPIPQTFLWWANVAARVHDHYQAFFPTDVTFVADHAKRAVSTFPKATNYYYGVDYRNGVDISWYKNIPVPTSYMITESKYDFFGGYDFEKHAGFVHVANRHVAPGKKLWTWGNHDFGWAWDRNLTDEGGPYIELMSGCYTDNQPDFSWLAPYETKTWSQLWYPIQEIGPAQNANERAALSLAWSKDKIRIGVCTTAREQARVVLSRDGKPLLERNLEIAPGKPLVEDLQCDSQNGRGLLLEIFDADNERILHWQAEITPQAALPAPATEPAAPETIRSNDELYLLGLHLEQYRHATRDPELYWREGLHRDPQDSRIRNAMGLRALRRGEFAQAKEHFRIAVERLTVKNPNPYDGEAYYNLGLTLRYLARDEEAYTAFYKAVWNYAWRSAAYSALASIDASRGDNMHALEHIALALQTNADNLKALNLRASLLRHMHRQEEAAQAVAAVVQKDALDLRAAAETFLATGDRKKLTNAFSDDMQGLLDVAFEYLSEGFAEDAELLLATFAETPSPVQPIFLYTLAMLRDGRGDAAAAATLRKQARTASSLYCFPARLEEMLVLEAALAADPKDGRAAYYLGNLLYDKHRYEEAIRYWEIAVKQEPGFSIPWRNLAMGQFNIHQDAEAALASYRRAFEANPGDARLLYEWDQLKKRVGISPEERLQQLMPHVELCSMRDDLSVEYVTLLNQTGQPQKALHELGRQHFSPWEGGEGLVSAQYVFAHVHEGKAALDAGDFSSALEHFAAARAYPHNLGEGKHLLTLERDIDYYTGVAYCGAGDYAAARIAFEAAAAPIENPLIPFGRHHYFQALALQQLGREAEATATLEALLDYAHTTSKIEPRIDYFATSLPNLLLFEDDLARANKIACSYLEALAKSGLGDITRGKELMKRILKDDPSHLHAREDLLTIELAPERWSRPDPEAIA